MRLNKIVNGGRLTTDGQLLSFRLPSVVSEASVHRLNIQNMKTQSISSSWTLFLKLILPVMWIAFFGTLVGFILLSEDGAYLVSGGTVTPMVARIMAFLFLFCGVLTFYLLFMRLKRVDVDTDFLYVTNYFKTRRYPYHNIEKIVHNRFLMSNPVTLYFKEAGSFGKKITFLSNNDYKEFLTQRPDIKQLVT